MDKEGNHLVNSQGKWLQKPASTSLRSALADRLAMSEALDLVQKLVAAFPNGGAQAGRSYLGALASLLTTVPRSVAIKCCDPINGVARETKFLPTIADLVGWCERETETIRRPVEIEDRFAALAAEQRERAKDDRPLTEQERRRQEIEAVRAKRGPNWGIKDPGAKRVITRAEAQAELVAQIGQDAFDALPDGGKEGWRTIGELAAEAAP